MTKVVVDAILKNKLLNLTRKIELCDESGRVLGTFVPIVDYEQLERTRPPLTDEELKRRSQGRSYTTAEVIAHLERL